MIEEAAIALRFALGTIFFLSGIAKLLNLDAFERVVREYQVGPANVSRFVAMAIPPTEAILGGCLLVGIVLRPAAIAVTALLIVFSVAVSANLARGRRIACGCFGTISQREISLFAVIRNLVLIGFALIVSWVAPAVLSLDGVLKNSTGGRPAIDAVGLLITGSLGAFALAITQEAIAVMRSQRALQRRMVDAA